MAVDSLAFKREEYPVLQRSSRIKEECATRLSRPIGIDEIPADDESDLLNRPGDLHFLALISDSPSAFDGLGYLEAIIELFEPVLELLTAFMSLTENDD
jgi:hypothetical protein